VAFTGNNTFGFVDIGTDGSVRPLPGAKIHVAPDGISFRVN
jgi:hypothetical protein